MAELRWEALDMEEGLLSVRLARLARLWSCRCILILQLGSPSRAPRGIGKAYVFPELAEKLQRKQAAYQASSGNSLRRRGSRAHHGG